MIVSEFLRLCPYFQNDSMVAVLRHAITTDIRNICKELTKHNYPFIVVEIVNYRVKHVTDGGLLSQSHCWLQARTNISRILLIFKSFQDMRFIEPCWDKWCFFVVGFRFVNYTMTASCKFLINSIFLCIWHIFKNIFTQLLKDF